MNNRHKYHPKLLLIFLFISIITTNVLFTSDERILSTSFHSKRISDKYSLRNKILEPSDMISISLLSPENNSINNGGTEIQIEFLDPNGTQVQPVTQSFRWDYSSNYEAILRPLPEDDGLHILEVESESESGKWSHSKYHFYSDNVPYDITLNSPDNGTSAIGGSDIVLWESSYPSGTLNAIEFADCDNDHNYDVLVGGSIRRVYSFFGRTGQPFWLSNELSSDILSIDNLDNNSIVVGLSNGIIHLLNTNNGISYWDNSSESSTIIDIKNNPTSETFIALNKYALRSFNYSGFFNWNVSFSINDAQKFLLLDDQNSEIILINESSHVKVFNITNGNLEQQFQTTGPVQSAETSNIFLYFGTDNGYVRKYNISSGLLIWEQEIETYPIIYDLKIVDNDILIVTSNGRLIRFDSDDGSIQFNTRASSTFIKYLEVGDFDKNSIIEALIFDTSSIKNFNSESGNYYWNYTLSSPKYMVIADMNNNTYADIGLISGDNVLIIDPRATIPKAVPSWTNVSFSFNDEICGDSPIWEKYSWDGSSNTSTPGFIPESSGIHTLDVWVSDNASNIEHSQYQFYSIINVLLNSPENETYVQSDTLINLTYSETPLEASYKWDDGSFQSVLSHLPASEITHNLYIILKDQSHNIREFHFTFTTDDTPISSINLISPINDSLVEGGEEITIQFSETPFIEYFSWNGEENTTGLYTIPVESDTHTLIISAADRALNWKIVIFVFHTKIRINLDTHSNNTVIDPSTILCFSFGEAPDIYQYKIDDNNYLTFNDHNQTVNITMPSISYTHYLTIRVNDSFNGRWNEEFYVFKTRILVNLTSHQDNGYAETGDLLVITFSDEPITRFFSWDGDKNSSRLPSVPGPDGSHFLDIFVGNIEADFWYYHYDFVVDTDLIDIILINPLNNTRVNSRENISIQFGETPHSIIYRWDDSTPTNNLPSFPSNNSEHILNVTVLDEAGNVNTKIFYWIVDDILINITLINFDENRTFYSGEIIPVSYNNETPKVLWYRWDSGGYSPDLPPVPCKNGTHILNITAFDGLNWNTELFNITVIDIPPIITILEPSRPYQTGETLSVNINEDVSDSWHKWNNGSKKSGTAITVPSTDGIHNLTIYAEDLGGSLSYLTIPITVDNTPIELVSMSPSNNSLVQGGENMTIIFSEMPFSITYSWDSGQRKGNLTSIPTELGSHVLNIRAFDEAGNLLEVNIIYRIPTETEKIAPFLLVSGLFGGLTLVSISIVGFKKKGAIGSGLSSLKNKLRPPKTT